MTVVFLAALPALAPLAVQAQASQDDPTRESAGVLAPGTSQDLSGAEEQIPLGQPNVGELEASLRSLQETELDLKVQLENIQQEIEKLRGQIRLTKSRMQGGMLLVARVVSGGEIFDSSDLQEAKLTGVVIPLGASVKVFDIEDNFVRVEYEGTVGYVMAADLDRTDLDPLVQEQARQRERREEQIRRDQELREAEQQGAEAEERIQERELLERKFGKEKISGLRTTAGPIYWESSPGLVEWTLNGRNLLADFGSRTFDATVIYHDNQFYKYRVSFGEFHFDYVADSLIRVLGRPATDLESTVQNRMGAEFDQRTLFWDLPKVSVYLSKRMTTIDEGIMLVTYKPIGDVVPKEKPGEAPF
jgi:hypothetical protein